MIDIRVDIEGGFDLLIANGDFVSNESTRQHQTLLLLCEKGELREFPTRGIGIQGWIADEVTGDFNSTVKREYEADGMKVLSIKGSITNLQVEAVYE